MLLNYVLAVLSGVLLVLIHPRANLTFLAPFAIAPLLYALAREWVPKHRFLLGYVTGLVFWAGVNYWIHFVISFHGGLGNGLGTVGFLLFVVLRAIPLGLFGLLGGMLIQDRLAVIGIPALWVAIERMPWLFGYTWLQLGNAGIDMLLPMRLAPFTGVYGLSFVFAMLGTAVTIVALRRERRLLWPLGLLLPILALPSLPPPEKGKEVAVSVQPNIADRDDWTTQMALDLEKQLDALSLAPALANQTKPNLILWPEVPAPLYYYDDAGLRERLTGLARVTGSPVLIGTVARTDKGAPLNSAVMVTSDGSLAGRYDKIDLVPFGEYIPFPFKGLVEKVSSEVGDFAAGSKIMVFPGAIGSFICYESAFPHLVRGFVSQGATVLANLSNDGYFGGSAARQQHLSLVRMRAAENRRWILRSTNDGVTASVDPAGRIVKTLPEFQQTSGLLPFTRHSELTFYSSHGDVFAWTCMALAAGGLANWYNHRHRR